MFLPVTIILNILQAADCSSEFLYIYFYYSCLRKDKDSPLPGPKKIKRL